MKRLNQITSVVLVCIGTASLSLPQVKELRAVRFDNFTYPWNGLPDSMPMTWCWIDSPWRETVRLVRGTHKFVDSDAPAVVREHSPILRFDSAVYGDLAAC